MVCATEVYEPEQMAELSALFETTWAAFAPLANPARVSEDRARLACILLRLYELRQLGPDQVSHAALRLMTQSPFASAKLTRSPPTVSPLAVPSD